MKEISTLIWNEWRRQRKTFFILFGTTVVFYALIALLRYFNLFLKEIDVITGALIIGFPVLYAVVINDSFAVEFANKSNSFLLGLPISKTKIYSIKYLSSVLLFLAISTIGSLLVYTYSFFGKVSFKAFFLATSVQLSIWILVHAAVFFCNLINRNNKNGIIMLLVLPVLLIILAPGIFSVNMFFFTTDAYWLTTSTISTIIILYLILLMSGWYLWNTRISKDLRCLKPILKTLGLMVTAPVLLYGLAYLYINYQYSSALQEAKENMLLIERPSKLPLTELSNAVTAFTEYIKEHKVNRMPLYKKLASQPYLASARKALQKKQNTGKEYLNNQDVKNLYSILEKISDKYKTQNDKDFFIARYYTRLAIIFLTDFARAQANVGNNKDFFRTLRLAAKYCIILRKIEIADIDSVSSMLLRDIYHLVIRSGQKNPEYADDYQKALGFIQNDKTYCPAYDFLSHLRYVKSLLDPRSSRNNNFNTSYYRLRAKQGIAAWIRYEIKRNKLYLEAEKTLDLKKIIQKNKQLVKEEKKIPGHCGILVYGNGLENYLLSRSRMAGDKISLALKIFRCRHGKFPDKLQKLCPEILKEIPLVTIKQSPFKYKKLQDGFTLNAGEIKRLYSNKKSFGYDIYTMHYNCPNCGGGKNK